MKFQIVLVSVFVAVANAGLLQSGYGGGGFAGPQLSQVGYSVSHQGGYGGGYGKGYQSYQGPIHVPILDKRGVPFETPEVQAAKQQHFQAYQLAQAKQASLGWQPAEQYGSGGYAQSYSSGWQPAYGGYGGYGYAQPITAQGVPEETPEVKLAKAQHFAAYAVEQSKHGQWAGQAQHGGQW